MSSYVVGPFKAAWRFFSTPSLPLVLVVIAIVSALAAAGAGKLVWTYKDAQLTALAASHAAQDARRAAAVTQAGLDSRKVQDAISVRSSARTQAAQTQIVTVTNDIIREVPTYVTVTQDRACIPYGLVRVLDAAITGRDPASLDLPAGQSDDACSPLTTSALARGIIDGVVLPARQNAQQLDDLQADIRERIDAANAGQEVGVLEVEGRINEGPDPLRLGVGGVRAPDPATGAAAQIKVGFRLAMLGLDPGSGRAGAVDTAGAGLSIGDSDFLVQAAERPVRVDQEPLAGAEDFVPRFEDPDFSARCGCSVPFRYGWGEPSDDGALLIASGLNLLL